MTRAALSILLLRLLGAALTYAFVVAMSRVMTMADFGILGTVMSASQFLSVFGSFGQPMALVRFVPPLLAVDRQRAAHDLIAQATKLTFMGNALLWVVIAGGAVVCDKIGLIDDGWVVAFGLLIMPLTGLMDLQANLARSYKLILLAIGPKDVLWRALSLLVVGAVLLATRGERISLTTCFIIMIATMLILIVATQVLAQSRHGLPSLHELRNGRRDQPAFERWSGARVHLWLVSFSAMAMGNIDVVITALLLGPEAAGIYFAANRIAQAPVYFQQSYHIVISPILSELHATGDSNGAERAARSAGLQIFLPTLVASAALLLAAGLVLGLFGPEFHRGLPVLSVLLAATVANTLFGPVDIALIMCGQEKLSMQLGLLALVVGVVLITVLGLVWGAIGIAAGVLVTTVFRRICYWVAVYRILDMRIDIVSAVLTLSRRQAA